MVAVPPEFSEEFEEIKLRGRYLQMAVDAEMIISMTIAQCFNYDKAQISSFYQDSKGRPKDLDDLNFFEKVEVCKQGLATHYPEFYAAHLADIETLDALRVMRNMFAHQKMDFNNNYPGSVLMSKLASNYRVETHIYSIAQLWADLEVHRASINNFLRIVAALIGYNPPSISPPDPSV
jgi:hypothetical protein